jgi:alpha-tubulin suppressor-like RCC1 family protein
VVLFALFAALLSCARSPTALVFRVMAENLVPSWCDLPGHRGMPECPLGAYTIDSVLVRVCRGACATPEANECMGNELSCRSYVDGPARTPPNIVPGDVVVTPRDAAEAPRIGIVVLAQVQVPGAPGERPTIERIRRRFVVPFAQESVQVVEVWLSSLCIGAVCPPESTCGRRSCEPVENPPTRPFSPLPPAGPVDAGAHDVSFEVIARDAGTRDAADGSDVPEAKDTPDVPAPKDTPDVPAMDVSAMDVSAMDVSAMDVPTMDVPTMDVPVPDVSVMDVLADREVSLADVATDEAGLVDTAGGCASECLGRSVLCCSGTCVDTSVDRNHCGACGARCNGACEEGTCRNYATLAVGGAHACRIREDGAVECWGRNHRGQLGDEAVSLRASPTRVTGVTRATSVAAGDAHTCAIADGTIVCWGANDARQVAGRADVAEVAGVTNVFPRGISPVGLALAAGAAHTCAMTADGVLPTTSIRCWGSNTHAQVGVAASTRSDVVTLSDTNLRETVDLAAGASHTCALLSTGHVRCWGSRQYGQLGDGVTDSAMPSPASQRVLRAPGVALTNVTAIRAAGDTSCALTAEGVWCWGRNHLGQLANAVGLATTHSAIAVLLPATAGATRIAMGARGGCAAFATGVRCWGASEYGLAGLSRRAVGAGLVTTPRTIEATTGATALAVGDTFACMTRSGLTACWGSNVQGQLGNGDGGPLLSPHAARALGRASLTAISLGDLHGCGVDAMGVVFCWGNNRDGACGGGDVAVMQTPTRVVLTGTATRVCAGGNFSCALMEAGDVRCWGDNGTRQLGRAGTTLPGAAVEGLTNADDVRCGLAHACAHTTTGDVLCWGANNEAQAGQTVMSGAMVSTATAVGGLPGGATVTTLSVGATHNCVRLTDARVWCWGGNTHGQLGDGGTVSMHRATEVPMFRAADGRGTLSVGAQQTCALAMDQVWCWGYNGDASLALAVGDRHTPTPLMVMGATTVSTGARTSCAVLTGGQLRCWGDNTSGEVGIGSSVDVITTPTVVPSLTSVNSVHNGGQATCVRLMDGTVRCWGSNTHGQLGDGAAYSLVPVTVGLDV